MRTSYLAIERDQNLPSQNTGCRCTYILRPRRCPTSGGDASDRTETSWEMELQAIKDSYTGVSKPPPRWSQTAVPIRTQEHGAPRRYGSSRLPLAKV